MTQEKRILISPQDILSFGLECPHCHSTYLVPVAKIDRIPALCSNCQQRLIAELPSSSSELTEMLVLQRFLESLRGLQFRDFGSHIRFEIKGEVKQGV
jgi:hypothetical protein